MGFEKKDRLGIGILSKIQLRTGIWTPLHDPLFKLKYFEEIIFVAIKLSVVSFLCVLDAFLKK